MEFFSNPLHLMLLIVVIVLLFGANKLGDVGGAVGRSIREFKKEAGKDDEEQPRRSATPPTAPYAAPAPPAQGYNSVQAMPAQPLQSAPNGVPPAASYQPAEPARRPDVAIGDYRPSSPAQPTPAPPAAGALPPDYSGR